MTLTLVNISIKFRICTIAQTLWEVIEEDKIIQSWIFIAVRSQPRKFSCCFVLTNETFIEEIKSM
jgi:hypothetical protein